MNYNTSVIKIDRDAIDKEAINRAADLIKSGQLVAFPTETVYGLGGNALDPEASKKIYAAKGRPSDNPLIVHIADKEDIYRVGKDVPEACRALMDRFWPGPLTIIVKKADDIPKATTGGLDTVAVRLPSDEIARELIRASETFIAAPSANASGRPSTTRAEHCLEDLAGRIPMILDGGPVKIGLESTIVDLTGDKPMVLRPGYITIEDLKEVFPEVSYDPAVVSTKKDEKLVAKAPGMKYRHYAPKGELTIFSGQAEKVVERINKELAAKKAEGLKVAVLATEESKDGYQADYVISLGSRKSMDELASHLFESLREFDDLGAQYIYGESFSTDGVGQAIMNRLIKACGYNIIEI